MNHLVIMGVISPIVIIKLFISGSTNSHYKQKIC